MSDPCSPDPIEEIQPTRCVQDPTAINPSWEGKDDTSPYINPRNCHLSIVVDKTYGDPRAVTAPVDLRGAPFGPPRTGGDGNLPCHPDFECLGWRYKQYTYLPTNERAQQELVRRYMAYGIDKLLKFYNKRIDYNSAADLDKRNDLIERALENFNRAREVDPYYHIHLRPNSKMKILVAIHVNEFDRFSDLEYRPSYSESSTRVAEYDVRLIKTQIEFVAKVINDHYGKRHGNPFGNTRNLNLRSESRKMSLFVNKLQRLLTDNRVDLNLDLVLNTRQDKIKVVLNNENYTLLDIVYVSASGEEKYLRSGWPRMMRNTTQTTAGLIFWTRQEIFSMFNSHINPTWTKFVEKYIYPRPDMNMAFGSGINNLDDINQGVDDAIQFAQEALGWANYGNGVLSGDRSLMPLIDNAVKTEADLRLENDNIFNRAFQSNLISRTDNVYRNTDTGPFVDWGEVWDRIDGNLDALYEHVLNHIDLRYLMAKIAACAGMDALIDSRIIEILENLTDFLRWLANIDWATFDFDWNFIQLGQDLLEDLINYVMNYLINLVNIAITEFVLWLLEQLDKMCEEDFNYEAVDISALLSNKFNSAREAATFYDSLAKNIGDGSGSSGLLRQLMGDISVVLSTSELCSLLKGAPSVQVTTIIGNIILQEKYAAFHERFQTREDIITFFSSLGDLVNSSFCELGTYIQDVDVCSDSFYQDLRESLLSERGVPQEQIDRQLTAERNRRQELLSQLGEIINSTDGNLSQRISDVLNKGDIAKQIANHSVAGESINSMVQSMFQSPVITIINEGLGFLETPYTSIEYKLLPAGLARQHFLHNRGIMHVLSDIDEFRCFAYGATLGHSGFLERQSIEAAAGGTLLPGYGGGLVEQLSLINLNNYTTPDPSVEPLTTFKVVSPNRWVYETNLAKRIGDYVNFKPRVKYEVSYDLVESFLPWWGTEYPDLELTNQMLDNPTISAPFIYRDPMLGFQNVPKSNEGVLKNYNNSALIIPNQIMLSRMESHEPQSVPAGPRILGASLRLWSDFSTISVFNDLPQVFKEELVPNYDSPDFVFPGPPAGSRQQTAYVNFFTSKIMEFVGEDDPDISADTYQNWVRSSPSKVYNTYQNVFNDVVRTLYRFVTDSEYLYQDSSVYPRQKLSELKLIGFKDSETVMKLAGLEGIERTIQENLADSLQGEDNLTEATFDILGESSLRFFIRIYILEIFLKNLYMLTSLPERSGIEGMFVLRPGSTSLEQVYRGPEAAKSQVTFRALDLEDISDPIMVSYILEYIEFSNSRMPASCQAHLEVADRLIKREMSELPPSTDGSPSSLPPIKSNITTPMSKMYQDVLAYYPPKDNPTGGTPKDALRYYIAKELQSGTFGFLKDFQNFINSANSGAWRTEFGRAIPEKRTLIESFLDKLQTVGYNVRSAGPQYDKWEQYGEGLYMEFYIRSAETQTVHHVDLLRFADLDVILPRVGEVPQRHLRSGNTFGLRVCVRDSYYHSSESGGVSLPIIRPSSFTQALSNPVIGAEGFGSIYEYAASRDISAAENSWSLFKGVPIVTYEESWDVLRTQLGPSFTIPGSPPSMNLIYQEPGNLKIIIDFLKQKIVQTPEFRTMFEYVFPVKKMFNMLFIMMDQNASAFMNNTKRRGPTQPAPGDDDILPGAAPPADYPKRIGILNASSIDPEQFRRAKEFAKSILENVNNSDNYRYTNATLEEAGGVVHRLFDDTVEDL